MDIEKLREDIEFRTELRDQELVFRSTWGLFSPREVDEGSRLLLRYVDQLDRQRLVTPWHVKLLNKCGDGLEIFGRPGNNDAARCRIGRHLHPRDRLVVGVVSGHGLFDNDRDPCDVRRLQCE